MAKHEKHPVILDEEEKELLTSFEKGEWVTVKNIEQEKARAKASAANFSRKDTRVNVRLSRSDLARLKRRAAYEGLPYQTLITSILHKYAAGHL